MPVVNRVENNVDVEVEHRIPRVVWHGYLLRLARGLGGVFLRRMGGVRGFSFLGADGLPLFRVGDLPVVIFFTSIRKGNHSLT